MASRILVVDANPQSRAQSAIALRKEGFEVAAAATVKQALAQLTPRPAAVFCDYDLPDGDAIAVCEQVRANPETWEAPFFVLARREDAAQRERARAAGADDFVFKPFATRDLLTLARLFSGHRAGEPIVFGDFATTPLFFVLRALTSGYRSGLLECTRERGSVHFREGHIVEAAAGAAHGDAALARLLVLADGPFSLRLGPVLLRGTMNFTLRDLVTREEPRRRRFERAVAVLGGLGSKLVIDFSALARELKGLPPSIERVVRLFDGSRTLGDVVRGSELDEITTVESILRLRAMHVLRPMTETDAHRGGARPRLFEPTPDDTREAREEALDEASALFVPDLPFDAPAELQEWFNEFARRNDLDIPEGDGGWRELSVGEAGARLRVTDAEPRAFAPAVASPAPIPAPVAAAPAVTSAPFAVAPMPAAVAAAPSPVPVAAAPAPMTAAAPTPVAVWHAPASEVPPAAAPQPQPAAAPLLLTRVVPTAAGPAPASASAAAMPHTNPMAPAPATAGAATAGAVAPVATAPVATAPVATAPVAAAPVAAEPMPEPAAAEASSAEQESFFDSEPDFGAAAPAKRSRRVLFIGGGAVVLLAVLVVAFSGGSAKPEDGKDADAKQSEAAQAAVAAAPAPLAAAPAVPDTGASAIANAATAAQPGAPADTAVPPAAAPAAAPPAAEAAAALPAAGETPTATAQVAPADKVADGATEKLPGADAQQVQELVAKGKTLYDRGQANAALKPLEEATRLAPRDATAHLYLALSKLDAGNLDEAEKLARRTLDLDANSARAHVVLGTVAYERRDPATARAEYDAYLKLEPKGPYVGEVRQILSSLR